MVAKKRKYKTLLPHYLQGLAAGKYTLQQAADACGYSVVRMCQLKKAYMQRGFQCLEHGNKGRRTANKTPETTVKRILQLYASPMYAGINFKYFRECLSQYENIYISYTGLLNIFRTAGIVSPESHKVKHSKPVHRPRVRRDNYGDLLQIDGSQYAWFQRFGNYKKYCLVGAIDDATSRITGLYMTENECLYGYLEILRQTIKRDGCPREIYSDRSAIFCVTPKKRKDLTVIEELAGVHDKRTQWQRILSDLNIRQVLAWSPQAKGRIERLWSTLQKRLPCELFRAGCDTVEKANKFLQRYVENFNACFAVEPMRPDSFFVPCSQNLDTVLSAQVPRKADSNGCISFHSYKFAVLAPRVACRKLTLHISERGIYARFDNDDNFYNVRLLDDHISYGIGETMPQVVADIINRYMFEYAKEISA